MPYRECASRQTNGAFSNNPWKMTLLYRPLVASGSFEDDEWKEHVTVVPGNASS